MPASYATCASLPLASEVSIAIFTPCEQRVAAQLAGERHAVHDRHLHVDHRRVERGPGAGRGTHQLERRGAVVGRRDVHPDRRQLHLEDAAIGRVVLGENHPPAAQHGRIRCRRRSLRRHRSAAEREAEHRALAELALDFDRAAHQLHQLLADRESEPGTAVPARHRLVGLHEHGEELRERVRASCRCRCREPRTWRGGRPPLRHRRHRDHDFARLGELDRIADEVGQHLAQPRRDRRARPSGPRRRAVRRVRSAWRARAARAVRTRPRPGCAG